MLKNYAIKRQEISLEYGVSPEDIDITLSQTIGEVCKFEIGSCIVDDNVVAGYRKRENGERYFGRQNLSSRIREEIVRRFEKKIEDYYVEQKKHELKTYFTDELQLLDCKIVDITGNKYIVNFIDKRGKEILNAKGFFFLDTKSTLKKDIMRDRYKINAQMAFEVLFDEQCYFSKGNWYFAVTRRSENIIRKHLKNIQEALLKAGIKAKLQIISVDFMNEIAYLKREGHISNAAKNFIAKKLGFEVKFATF